MFIKSKKDSDESDEFSIHNTLLMSFNYSHSTFLCSIIEFQDQDY